MPEEDTPLKAISPMPQVSDLLELFHSAMALDQSGRYAEAFRTLEQYD